MTTKIYYPSYIVYLILFFSLIYPKYSGLFWPFIGTTSLFGIIAIILSIVNRNFLLILNKYFKSYFIDTREKYKNYNKYKIVGIILIKIVLFVYWKRDYSLQAFLVSGTIALLYLLYLLLKNKFTFKKKHSQLSFSFLNKKYYEKLITN